MIASFDWTLWRPATCMPDHCFCEAVRAGVIRQPANAFSSLAFVVVALLVLRESSGPATNPAPAYRAVYAIALTIIGLGSAFYHASLTFAGQFIDVMGMNFIATFVVLYAFGRIRHLDARVVAIIYLVLNAGLAWILLAIPELRRHAFAVLILLGLGLEYGARKRSQSIADMKGLGYAVGLVAIGFVVWTLDITRVVCSPHSVMQGHAIWHVLGAAASWQVYRYYRSEALSAT
jgi:hypothetical protein